MNGNSGLSNWVQTGVMVVGFVGSVVFNYGTGQEALRNVQQAVQELKDSVTSVQSDVKNVQIDVAVIKEQQKEQRRETKDAKDAKDKTKELPTPRKDHGQ